MTARNNLPKNYENNPFYIAVKGMTLLFDFARGIAIVFVILSAVFVFWGGPEVPVDSNGNPDIEQINQSFVGWSTDDWVTAVGATVIIGSALLLLAALFGGVSAYTSARLARNKTVSLNEAFKVAFDNLWSFLWLQLIIFVKLLLWTLLFIVPGIIMSVRYSLASVAYFDKNLRGNDAIKESLRLTKGAWFTTFAANALLNYMTLGVISWVVATGANAILYRQFTRLGDKKPDAHWLSWLTFFLPFIFIVLLIMLLILILSVIVATGGKLSQ